MFCCRPNTAATSFRFLQNYIPYQEKYINSVIIRIFYNNDFDDDGRLSFDDFKKSDLMEVIRQVCNNEVNKVRKYFSYEHFYVLYNTFFNLVNDKNSNLDPENELFLSKEKFSKYEYNSLSKKTIDRIFGEIPRKFSSSKKGMMSFEDFIWFMLSEEDKTNKNSIKYWFKVIDLDGNGIITKNNIEYFYEEQIQRLKNYNSKNIQFSDILNRFNIMIPSETKNQWTLQDFLDHPKNSSIVFNILLNINKFIENEEKEDFLITEIDKRVDYTDWDKFAYKKYLIYMEEGNKEDDE